MLSLCLELNRFDFKIDESYRELADFEHYEREFYDAHIEEILRQEQHIGVSMSYKHIFKKIKNKLAQEAENPEHIVQKLWRIEDTKNQKVYFLATFEHLMTKYHSNETAFALFGLWRMYSQIYRRKGWQFNLICTML